ncbi:MAG: DNA methyltransferase [Candidatus Sericytochromatia bacterium]|nr:DNA methyltransferase [Candidatus Sericytochromatia bacterium]
MTARKPRVIRRPGSLPPLHATLQRLEGLESKPVLDEALDGLIAEANDPTTAVELRQAREARSLERARYYLTRLRRGLEELRTGPDNDLDLGRWKTLDHIHTDSLWLIDRRERSGAHTAGYWGNFIPQIPQQMMLRYTKAGEVVLDPFAGSGTTLLEAQRLGRHVLGIELQAEVARQARARVASEPNLHDIRWAIAEGDCATADLADELARLGHSSVQLAILHPPYHDIIRFSDDPRDMSNAPDVKVFLDMFRAAVRNVAKVLDKGRTLVVVIGDMYRDGEWIPLGFQTMQTVLDEGFKLRSIVVKNFEDTTGKRSSRELWRYRALSGGFYVFKHEYVFIFRKPGKPTVRPEGT